MTEHFPTPDNSDRPDIPRCSPVFEARFLERDLTLSWYNTTVVFYPRQYGEMNHIEIDDPSQEVRGVVFACEPQMNALFSADFPCLRAPEPTDKIVDAYVRWRKSAIPDSPAALTDLDDEREGGDV